MTHTVETVKSRSQDEVISRHVGGGLQPLVGWCQAVYIYMASYDAEKSRERDGGGEETTLEKIDMVRSGHQRSPESCTCEYSNSFFYTVFTRVWHL